MTAPAVVLDENTAWVRLVVSPNLVVCLRVGAVVPTAPRLHSGVTICHTLLYTVSFLWAFSIPSLGCPGFSNTIPWFPTITPLLSHGSLARNPSFSTAGCSNPVSPFQTPPECPVSKVCQDCHRWRQVAPQIFSKHLSEVPGRLAHAPTQQLTTLYLSP